MTCVSFRGCLIAASLLTASACNQPPDVPTSRITEWRVIGVRAEPAEVAPYDQVTWTAIVASPKGFVSRAQINWSLCMLPRGPSDPITVSPVCYGDAPPPEAPDGGTPEPVLVDLNHVGVTQHTTIPGDACKKVGPDVPEKDPQGNPQRPPDADITGGYQLPVRLTLKASTGTDVSFERQRVHCELTAAPADVALEYHDKYVKNSNPVIKSVSIAGQSVTPDGEPSVKVPSRTVKLKTHWDAKQSERYVLYDPETRKLAERDEVLDVAWFTDGGEFEFDRTTPDGNAPQSTNTLTIDESRSQAHVWILLRDDRGGLGVAKVVVNID